MTELNRFPVIVVNGDFPIHFNPLNYLENASEIICCDGATDTCVQNGFRPTLIIGDFDSISKENKENFHFICKHIPDQHENDLRKAIKWLESKGFNKVIIVGATGKREDHTLGNIFSILQFETKLKIKLITDYGEFSIADNGQNNFNSFKGQQISVFSTDNSIIITSCGLKYPLEETSLPYLYSGTLNESNSDKFTLTLNHGKVMVYQAYGE